MRQSDQQEKQEKLARAERLWFEKEQQHHPFLSQPTPSVEETKQQNALTALINKIVDNLQFTIKDVHVRYEDNTNPLVSGILCPCHLK